MMGGKDDKFQEPKILKLKIRDNDEIEDLFSVKIRLLLLLEDLEG